MYVSLLSLFNDTMLALKTAQFKVLFLLVFVTLDPLLGCYLYFYYHSIIDDKVFSSLTLFTVLSASLLVNPHKHLAFQSSPPIKTFCLFVFIHFSVNIANPSNKGTIMRVLVVLATTFPSFLLKLFHSRADTFLYCVCFSILTDKLCLVFVYFCDRALYSSD